MNYKKLTKITDSLGSCPRIPEGTEKFIADCIIFYLENGAKEDGEWNWGEGVFDAAEQFAIDLTNYADDSGYEEEDY